MSVDHSQACYIFLRAVDACALLCAMAPIQVFLLCVQYYSIWLPAKMRARFSKLQ